MWEGGVQNDNFVQTAFLKSGVTVVKRHIFCSREIEKFGGPQYFSHQFLRSLE